MQTDLATAPAGAEWWQKRQRAELQLQLGLALQALGRRDEARAALEAAVEAGEAAATSSRTVLVQQRLAGARTALAAHILAEKPDADTRVRCITLLTAAEQFYRSSGPGYAWRMADLSALRRRTGAD